MKYFPFWDYSAMCWCGKIITRKDNLNEVTINHERIHLEQAYQIGKSWTYYYLQYLKYWIKGNPFSKSSYYTIPFEMEAYGNDYDFNYSVTKDSWKRYIIKDRNQIYQDNEHNWKQFCRTL